MTATQKSALRIGILTSVVAGLLLLAASKLASQVILRPELEAMSARIENRLSRIEDVQRDLLCHDAPTHWRCR